MPRLFNSQNSSRQGQTMQERIEEWREKGNKVPFNFRAVADASKEVVSARNVPSKPKKRPKDSIVMVGL